MHIDFLKDRMTEAGDADALIWNERAYSYAHILTEIEGWEAILDEQDVERGAVVGVEADFSPRAIALMLALIERSCIFVPLTAR